MRTITPLNSVLDRMVTLSRAMDEALAGDTGVAGQAYWAALDAWESEHEFVVKLDLPGVRGEDLDISFERNVLTVTGSRPSGIPRGENGDRRVFLAERPSGTFTRSLRFPQYVEGDKIAANFENGVLTVVVPKPEAAKPRKIAITSPTEVRQVKSESQQTNGAHA